MLGWAVVAVFPTLGRTADSLLDTTLEDTKLYFTSPLRWGRRLAVFRRRPGRNRRRSLI
jgi:hypothetical protein